MYMDIGLLGPLASRRPHGVLKMWQLIEAAMRTPWERLQPSDKAVKPLWPMWHVTIDSWCALSKLKMVRKCLSYEHKNKTYWQKCHHDAVFDMNTDSEFAPWPNLSSMLWRFTRLFPCNASMRNARSDRNSGSSCCGTGKGGFVSRVTKYHRTLYHCAKWRNRVNRDLVVILHFVTA